MKQLELYGRIDPEGTLRVNRKQIEAFCKENPSKYIRLVIEAKNKRTSPQNRYMHLMFTMMVKGFQDIGYRGVKNKDHVKQIMKRMFLMTKIKNEQNGGEIELIKDTSDCSKEELSVFIDECIQFAAEYLGIVIPPPNTQTKLF